MFSAPTPTSAPARDQATCAVSAELPTIERGDWFVLRTRTRQERILAADLRARSIGCFLPMRQQERMYGASRIMVQLPLFPGYLFLRGTLEEAYWADRTKRVAQIIQVADQKLLDRELSNLAQILAAADWRLDPYPYLKAGVHVEVVSGPLRGVRGIVEDRTRLHRLVLQISALGQAVSVELDAAIVEPIDVTRAT